jgi:Leucine-rich repeat (LRR) protein
LKALKTLLLHNNQLTHLPIELGELRRLEWLTVSENPIAFPSPQTVRLGSSAILAALRTRARSS